jgi:hypothetical protein
VASLCISQYKVEISSAGVLPGLLTVSIILGPKNADGRGFEENAEIIAMRYYELCLRYIRGALCWPLSMELNEQARGKEKETLKMTYLCRPINRCVDAYTTNRDRRRSNSLE